MPKASFNHMDISPGYTLKVSGHPFTVEKVKRYVSKTNGSAGMIVHWLSTCADCGEAKQFTTGSCDGTFPVQCLACYRASVTIPADEKKAKRAAYRKAWRARHRAPATKPTPAPVPTINKGPALINGKTFKFWSNKGRG